MCGIAGIVHLDPQKKVDKNILRAMVRSLHHRGPDGAGIFVDNNVGLGQARLSIQDLSMAALQPMCSADQKIWVTYNGEIYNYPELKKFLQAKGYQFRTTSDTEALIYAYDYYGEECVHHLEGMFAFVIFDKKSQKVFVSRDPLGIKPLYYYLDRSRLIFGSEIKAILQNENLDLSINHRAIYQYFQFLSIQGPDSIYSQIRRLEPGTSLTLQKGSVEKKKYWHLEHQNSLSQTELMQVEKDLANKLQKTVKSHLLSDVPVGSFLSGGIDSSITTALMATQVSNPVETFSVTFRGHEKFDEGPFARIVSNQYKTHHHEFEMTPDLVHDLPAMVGICDEPFAVSSAFALYLLSRETSKHVKVVLTGDGGDEVFAGYPRHHRPRKYARLTDFIPDFAKTTMSTQFNHLASVAHINFSLYPWNRVGQIWDQFMLPENDFFMRQMAVTSPRDLQGFFSQDYYQSNLKPFENAALDRANALFQEAESFDALNQRLYVDIKTALVDEMLTKVDRMTMAFGVEARVPFLDKALVEYAFRIPGSVKASPHDGKTLLKKVMGSMLPDQILKRSKWGFNVPLQKWFEKDLFAFTQDHLASLKKEKKFNTKTLDILLKDHARKRVNNSSQLFELLVWDLWAEGAKTSSMSKFAERTADVSQPIDLSP